MRLLDPQRIEQAHSVSRHISQPIGYLRVQPEQTHQRDPAELGYAMLTELLAEPDVPVVIADHMIPARQQRLDQLDRPQRQLRAKPHDEQQRRVGRISVRFVFKLDAVGGDLRHLVSLASVGPALLAT